MINLHKEFKQAVIENVYVNSVFDYEIYKPADLQICHILSNSEATKKAIMKAYNCNITIATLLTNMPLLNTVVGTREDNAEYKKTDDIVNIDLKMLTIVENIYCNIPDEYFFTLLKIKIFRDIFMKVCYSANTNYLVGFMLEDIKELQYRFHRETKIHH